MEKRRKPGSAEPPRAPSLRNALPRSKVRTCFRAEFWSKVEEEKTDLTSF